MEEIDLRRIMNDRNLAVTNWIRLMIRIVEKLEFMKVRAVTVCAKAGIGRNK